MNEFTSLSKMGLTIVEVEDLKTILNFVEDRVVWPENVWKVRNNLWKMIRLAEEEINRVEE